MSLFSQGVPRVVFLLFFKEYHADIILFWQIEISFTSFLFFSHKYLHKLIYLKAFSAKRILTLKKTRIEWDWPAIELAEFNHRCKLNELKLFWYLVYIFCVFLRRCTDI